MSNGHDDAVPTPIPPEASKGFGVEREIDRLDRALDRIDKRLLEGNRTIAGFREQVERFRDEQAQWRRDMEARFAALQLAEKDANEDIRRSAETRVITLRAEHGTKIEKLEDAIAPRATSGRVLRWAAVIVITVGPLIGLAWRSILQLESRISRIEATRGAP